MKLAQFWLAGMIALGAGYLVLAPNSHISQAFGAAQKFVSGTEHTALTGQA